MITGKKMDELEVFEDELEGRMKMTEEGQGDLE